MQNYEVEIKSLLGSKEKADVLREKLKQIDPSIRLLSRNKQLNHYFEGGDLLKLVEIVTPEFPEDISRKFKNLAQIANQHSVRTRSKDGKIFLVVKVSVDQTTSENGISRMELEEEMKDMSLDKVDQLVQWAGFRYQAKWSREREEWLCKGITVCLDKNAGYGWLAEFEKVVSSADLLASARAEIVELMQECGVEELPQERLERMFAHYNAHWPEYYGTEKIFTVN